MSAIVNVNLNVDVMGVDTVRLYAVSKQIIIHQKKEGNDGQQQQKNGFAIDTTVIFWYVPENGVWKKRIL